MLVGVAVYAKVFATPGEFADLRLDSLSTLFYVSNWHFIAGGSNYFDMTAQPSPLQHMWSLSIEEQFYIVWPPVALLMLHLGRRLRPSRRLWPILATAVVGAVASALDMLLSYRSGASVMRLYEGTDTRSQDILVGAALAIGMAIWAQHRAELPGDATSGPGRGRVERSHPAAGTTGQYPPRPHRRDPAPAPGTGNPPDQRLGDRRADGTAGPPGPRLVGRGRGRLPLHPAHRDRPPSCSRAGTSCSPWAWPWSSSAWSPPRPRR
jgi:hypothetical protein